MTWSDSDFQTFKIIISSRCYRFMRVICIWNKIIIIHGILFNFCVFSIWLLFMIIIENSICIFKHSRSTETLMKWRVCLTSVWIDFGRLWYFEIWLRRRYKLSIVCFLEHITFSRSQFCWSHRRWTSTSIDFSRFFVFYIAFCGFGVLNTLLDCAELTALLSLFSIAVVVCDFGALGWTNPLVARTDLTALVTFGFDWIWTPSVESERRLRPWISKC